MIQQKPLRLLLDSRLRFVQSLTEAIASEYYSCRHSQVAGEAPKETADWLAGVESRALDGVRLLRQVIAPLALEAQGEETAQAYSAAADRLEGIARHTEEQFPSDNGRLLVLDRLDAIDAKLAAVLERRKPAAPRGKLREFKAGVLCGKCGVLVAPADGESVWTTGLCYSCFCEVEQPAERGCV